METEKDQEEIKLHRLIYFANFLSGLKATYPTDPAETFEITKDNKGFLAEADNFTLTWAIALLPLVFGKHWAYSNGEKIILKSHPDGSTFNSLQFFFGITMEEYFHLFVAYFQNEKQFGGKTIRHDRMDSETLAENIREIVRKKMVAQSELLQNERA